MFYDRLQTDFSTSSNLGSLASFKPYTLLHQCTFWSKACKAIFGQKLMFCLSVLMAKDGFIAGAKRPILATQHLSTSAFSLQSRICEDIYDDFFRRKELGWSVRKFFRVISLRGVGKWHVLLTMSDFLLKNFNDSLM